MHYFFPLSISNVSNEVVTYKNTMARIVICRQDSRGRLPVYGTSSLKTEQSQNENPNKIKIFYMICKICRYLQTSLQIRQNVKPVHFAGVWTEPNLKNQKQ